MSFGSCGHQHDPSGGCQQQDTVKPNTSPEKLPAGRVSGSVTFPLTSTQADVSVEVDRSISFWFKKALIDFIFILLYFEIYLF